MSILQEFLIKSAGMEKEAKGAFRRLLEKGVTSLPAYKRSGFFKLRDLMKYVDLSVPLRKRIEQATGRSITRSSRDDKLSDFFNMLVSSKNNSYNLNHAYDNYLRRYIQSNPQLNRLNRRMRNALDADIFFRPANKMQEDLYNILGGRILSTNSQINNAAAEVVIPTLSEYIVKSPFATTHHLANARLSEEANKLAVDSFRKNPDVVYVNNPNFNAGWKQWRSDDIAVNVPGRPWTKDQLAEMNTSFNLSGTPLYETVFNPLSKDAPRIQKVYVPDTPTVRKSLNISDDIKPVTIDEIQSPMQGVLYKGRTDHSASVAPYYIKHPLNFDRLHKHVYGKVRRDPLLEILRENKAWILNHDKINAKSPLWFAPAARTSWGYMGKPDKLIPVTTAQLRKLRSIEEGNLKAIFDKAQVQLDTAPIEDLKAAAQAADKLRVIGNRMNRINSTAPALSEKLNIPSNAVEDLLLKML